MDFACARSICHFEMSDMQSLHKALDFFIALKFCICDFYFLNRHKKCKVATYNIVSVYMTGAADVSFILGCLCLRDI